MSEGTTAFVSIPYVKGVSERIRLVLDQENVKTGDVFKKPKDRPLEDQVTGTGIVYKVKCKLCSLTKSFVTLGRAKHR